MPNRSKIEIPTDRPVYYLRRSVQCNKKTCGCRAKPPTNMHPLHWYAYWEEPGKHTVQKYIGNTLTPEQIKQNEESREQLAQKKITRRRRTLDHRARVYHSITWMIDFIKPDGTLRESIEYHSWRKPTQYAEHHIEPGETFDITPKKYE